MARPCAVADPEHAGKSHAQKLGGLVCAFFEMAGQERLQCRNLVIDADEKSDTSIVPMKPTNKAKPEGNAAERAEGRGVTKGNADRRPASRTQSRIHDASTALEGIRKIARQDKGVRFTALLHHVTPQLLRESFYALRSNAAVGVDGMTWRDYEEGLSERLER